MSFWTDTTIFVTLSLFHALFYAYKRTEIFDWNPEVKYLTPDMTSKIKDGSFSRYNNRKTLNYPLSWKLNNFIHTFIGVLLGYFMLWILYQQKVKPILSGNSVQFEWSDFAFFLLGYIGIKGRLPTIADSVQEWFKR